MLILSRKKGQSIVIGDNIEIYVVGTEGDQVKIGIAAPDQIKVYRKEVYESIKESNRQALASPEQLQTMKQLAGQAMNLLKKEE
ncbi:carbon storage regulator CsrA [Cohnella sp. REN36]|uniref:carbon storage regulator CsrA n=1 Tax=Cohnella sp. REN36 TaxID=2887347 RepID=UPI001D15D120|nr:carbon storage regulator CsrA [Cohnella sp. REN36]MCC3374075.1 carbon storage regulator CsrA [Cohnella sp. REN36]